jgi:hypothetical protein
MYHLSKDTLFLNLFLSYTVAVKQDLQAVKLRALDISPTRSLTSHSATLFTFFIAAMSMQVTTSLVSIIKRVFKATTTRPEEALVREWDNKTNQRMEEIPAPPDDSLTQQVIELATLQGLTKE